MEVSCGKCRKSYKTSTSESRFHNLTFPVGPSLVIFCLLIYLPPLSQSATMPLDRILTSKRVALTSVADDSSDDGFPDYRSGVTYDAYPFVVPKRAALILDRILKEIESAKESNQLINDWSPISRRGNNKDKLYFRCYFNAVSCYKRK